jgi:nucleoid DNA-binding protein
MSKEFKDVPVYTRDSVKTTNDDKKKQEVIDEWTDELAVKMAEKTDCDLLDDGTVRFKRKSSRGGHNRQTIEVLNDEGYVVRVFNSLADTAMYFGVYPEKISRLLNGTTKMPVAPGFYVRRRETDSERQKRERLTNKLRLTRFKNKRNNGKGKIN